MSAIHQFVPVLEPSAVGTHTLRLQALLRAHGIPSEIFASVLHPKMRNNGHRYQEYGRNIPASPDDTLVYQLATGSELVDFLLGRPEKLVVNYHNITPSSFFALWEPHFASGLNLGRKQMRELGKRAILGITPSAFNEDELHGAGYAQTEVIPFLFDSKEFSVNVDTDLLAQLQQEKTNGGTDILFVGRISPNKCQHDIIAAFAAYRRLYDPNARLRLIGSSSSSRYHEALQKFTTSLKIEHAITFAGSVPQSALVAYYETADVFLCLSEHEGFCVPLLEAMHHQLPIVAYRSSAIPETLSEAGLLLSSKTPVLVAATLDRVQKDPSLRDAMDTAGLQRLRNFHLPDIHAQMLSALERARTGNT